MQINEIGLNMHIIYIYAQWPTMRAEAAAVN